jgi:hypothetical protein
MEHLTEVIRTVLTPEAMSSLVWLAVAFGVIVIFANTSLSHRLWHRHRD